MRNGLIEIKEYMTHDQMQKSILLKLVAKSMLDEYQKFKSKRQKLFITSFVFLIMMIITSLIPILEGLYNLVFLILGIVFFFLSSMSLVYALLILKFKLTPHQIFIQKYPILLFPFRDTILPLSYALGNQIKISFKANKKTPDIVKDIEKISQIVKKSRFPLIKPPYPTYKIEQHEIIGEEGYLASKYLEILLMTQKEYKDFEFELPMITARELLDCIEPFAIQNSIYIDSPYLNNKSDALITLSNKLSNFVNQYYVPSLKLLSVLRQIYPSINNYLNIYLTTRAKSIKFLNEQSALFHDLFALNSFGFYCPNCAQKKIYSEVLFNQDNASWKCTVCGNEFNLSELIPINKIKINLFYKVFDKLWIEKENEVSRIEREYQSELNALIRHTEEQELAIQNRIKQEIQEENRVIRQLRSEILGEEIALTSLVGTLGKYKRIHQERLNQYLIDCKEIKEEAMAAANKAAEIVREQAQKEWKSAVREYRQEYEKLKVEETVRHKEIVQKLSNIEKFTRLEAAARKANILRAKAFGERVKASRSFLPLKLIHKIKAKSLEKESGRLSKRIINEYINWKL